MGENSAIAWTDHTWNPWQGCRNISPACDNCYMYREKKRYGQDPAVVKRSSNRTFCFPYSLPKEPAKVFVCSWSDFFIKEADEWRNQSWEIIRATPHLTYQILTKRSENIPARLPLNWGAGWPNVWLGVTAENQEMADKRIPILLQIPSAVRFVSVEPMLGPVDVNPYLKTIRQCDGHAAWECDDNCPPYRPKLDWVICGGETGPKARPMHPDWVRNIRDQCRTAGIPFFFKQWGEWAPVQRNNDSNKIYVRDGLFVTAKKFACLDKQGRDVLDLPGLWDESDVDMAFVGKKVAGDILDGKQYHEFPEISG